MLPRSGWSRFQSHRPGTITVANDSQLHQPLSQLDWTSRHIGTTWTCADWTPLVRAKCPTDYAYVMCQSFRSVFKVSSNKKKMSRIGSDVSSPKVLFRHGVIACGEDLGWITKASRQTRMFAVRAMSWWEKPKVYAWLQSVVRPIVIRSRLLCWFYTDLKQHVKLCAVALVWTRTISDMCIYLADWTRNGFTCDNTPAPSRRTRKHVIGRTYDLVISVKFRVLHTSNNVQLFSHL